MSLPLIHCRECAEPMMSIYDPAIRHTCHECGGQSLSMPVEESREQILAKYKAKQAELKAERIAARAGQSC